MVFGNTLSQRIGSNRWGELPGLDGEPLGLEWKKFPGFITLGILNEIQKMIAELKFEPEQFQGRIIFMSMFNDIAWRTLGHEEHCVGNS